MRLFLDCANEEARAQMKAMIEQFRATETAMRLSELKANVCYLGLTPKHFFIHSAAITAKFHFVPHTLPLFSPLEGAATGDANFFR